jgi:hypothetical protein
MCTQKAEFALTLKLIKRVKKNNILYESLGQYMGHIAERTSILFMCIEYTKNVIVFNLYDTIDENKTI